MGAFIHDRETQDVLAQLNHRFSSGEEIREIAHLHREFDIFSPKRKLKDVFAALNIGPDRTRRRDWNRFLDRLNKYKSDDAKQTGHDRIITALKQNLESKNPLPVHYTVHPAEEDKGVRVTTGAPIVFSRAKHLVISIPTTPARRARGAGRKRGRRKQG